MSLGIHIFQKKNIRLLEREVLYKSERSRWFRPVRWCSPGSDTLSKRVKYHYRYEQRDSRSYHHSKGQSWIILKKMIVHKAGWCPKLVNHHRIFNYRLWRIPFAMLWKAKWWYDEEGDSACPPLPPLRLAMMTYYLFGGYRIGGVIGVEPPWAFRL